MRFSLPPSLSWRELVRRTVNESIADDCLGLAGELSYFLFLALFPAMLCLLAFASFFPLQNLTDDISRALGPVTSPQVLEIVRDQMRRLANADSGGLLTFGMLGALWSSSAAIVSIVSALNTAYDVTESRRWWKVRLLAIALTIGAALLILLAMSLVLGGGALADHLGQVTGFGRTFAWSWKILQWPLAFAMVTIGIGLIYYFGPDVEQDWIWVTPGAVLATVLWLAVSLGFKLYIAHFTDYNASYGSIGGVIVLMLWFYLSGVAILIGAELNSEIEHACPYGAPPGFKGKSGKLLIGARAERAWCEREELTRRSSNPVSSSPPRRS